MPAIPSYFAENKIRRILLKASQKNSAEGETRRILLKAHPDEARIEDGKRLTAQADISKIDSKMRKIIESDNSGNTMDANIIYRIRSDYYGGFFEQCDKG